MGKGGACSKTTGSTWIEHTEHWLTSRKECEGQCSTSLSCTAYEYSEMYTDRHGYKRCKLFTEPVPRSMPVPDQLSTCKKKVEPSPAAPVRSAPAAVIAGPVQLPSGSPPAGGLGGLATPAEPVAESAHAAKQCARTPKCAADVPLTTACACCHLLAPGPDGKPMTTDLTNMHQPCLDMNGGDFRGRNLEGVVMEDVKIDCACFDGATLVGVDMTNVVGEGATFVNARASGLNLEEAHLMWADFTGADLSSLQGQKGQFENAKFDRANLDGATFVEGNLGGATFEQARGLNNADFMWASGYGMMAVGRRLLL